MFIVLLLSFVSIITVCFYLFIVVVSVFVGFTLGCLVRIGLLEYFVFLFLMYFAAVVVAVSVLFLFMRMEMFRFYSVCVCVCVCVCVLPSSSFKEAVCYRTTEFL